MSSNLVTQAIPASGTLVLNGTNNFLMLIQTAASVTVRYWRDGTPQEASNIDAGYVKGLIRPWDRAEVSGTPGGTVRVLIGYEEIAEDFTDYRRTVGIFQQQQAQTIVDAPDVDVGSSAVAVLVAPANATRRQITFTNLDASLTNVRIGAQATVAANRGQRLQPGQSYTTEVQGALYAIRETAAAALVGVAEEVF